MQGVIQTIQAWFTSLTGWDIPAIAIAVIGIVVLAAAAKAALKIAGAVLGFVAVIYFVDPSVREVILNILGQLVSSVKNFFSFMG